MTAPEPKLLRTHYPALDGLRGIAILLVILYHNFNFIEYFNYGWLGVDLFFVLSGYLITDILLQSVNTRNYFQNFYARRVLRIFPLYYFSLLLFLLILPAIPSFPLDMSYYQTHQLWFWTYLQNWTLVFIQDGNSNALGHFWSLAVEEQYYLLWPLIILFLKKPKKVLLVSASLLLLVIASRFYIWNHRESIPPYERLFLFTRIDGILVGAMLASLMAINRNLLRRYFTLFLILLTGANYAFYFFKIGMDPDFPSFAIAGFTSFSFIFGLLVYEAVEGQNSWIQKILRFPLLRFLGKYSYGFYIFHWPVFLLVKPYADTWSHSLFADSGWPFQFTAAFLATAAGFVVSLLSFHLFEKHFLQLKKYFSN